jgi:hypothetical protein
LLPVQLLTVAYSSWTHILATNGDATMIRLLIATVLLASIAQPSQAEDRDVTNSEIPDLRITYAQAVEKGVRALLPAKLEYMGVGISLDLVSCNRVVLDSGVKSVWFRARYRGTVAGIPTPVADSIYVKYESGNVTVDIGASLKGVVNTKAVRDWLEKKENVPTAGNPKVDDVKPLPDGYKLFKPANGTYIILNDLQNKYLCQQLDKLNDEAGPGEKWEIKNEGGDLFSIKNVLKGKYFGQDKKELSGAVGDGEKWTFYKNSAGEVVVRCEFDKKKYLCQDRSVHLNGAVGPGETWQLKKE